MTTAIIGTGNIGGTLARHLVRGGEPVVLAAKDEANAAALAQELGALARAASVEEAIADAEAVVFAVWLDTTKELIAKDGRLLESKVVVDPSNPLGFDEAACIGYAARAIRPTLEFNVRMSVQFVFTTSSKMLGARNMRPAPTAHHDSSPSSLTSV
jgi:predicted dinucleotide-binding enzyme